MIHEVLSVGLLQCNCSILGDEATHEAIVVDPGDEIDRILAVLAKHQLTVKQIIVTHAHIDHIAGAARLKAVTGAPVFYNQLDLPLVKMMDMQAGWLGVATPVVAEPDASAEEGFKIGVTGIQGVVLHTPGHTEGSISLHFPEEHLLLAGDTLFAGSIGRTDLPGGDFSKIMASLKERLMNLPDDTRVIAGHGDATTIAKERHENQFLQDI
ncbi:MAG: MBL fold metallo-hydrolase [Acidobacteriaceae bacterium]|nr:MBL fold metallo-hydrolase [Acidobacteriaceae bacterium]